MVQPVFSRLCLAPGLSRRETRILETRWRASARLLDRLQPPSVALSRCAHGESLRRPPLAGGNAYNYTWDAYDRMNKVTRTGQNDVSYKYDALGRLLLRDDGDAGTTVTVNYWLGLAPLATEQWGSESGRNLAIFQPWIEAHAGPTSDGWYVYGGSGTKTLEYATDAGRGEVLHIATTGGGALDGQFIVGDKNGSNYNPNATDWSNANRKHLAFWVKNANTSNHFQFTVYCRFSSGDNILLFDSGTGSNASSAGTSTFYLGSAYSTLNDGGWHYVELDLQAYQRIFSGSGSLNDVDGLRFDCKNLYLDDPALSGGVLRRSYAVIPGADICGALGSWSGPNVGKDNGNAVRYFQYNDLGTVLAQTKADGSAEGAWEPDSNGNYECRQMLSGSPSRPELGVTGQVYDPAIGGMVFRHRMYDLERGIWLKEDPIGRIDGLNLYSFLKGNTLNSFDALGLNQSIVFPSGGPGGPERGPSHSSGMMTNDECTSNYEDRIAREKTTCYNDYMAANRPRNPFNDGATPNEYYGYTFAEHGAPYFLIYPTFVAVEFGEYGLYWAYKPFARFMGYKDENGKYIEANTGFHWRDIGLGMDGAHAYHDELERVSQDARILCGLE